MKSKFASIIDQELEDEYQIVRQLGEGTFARVSEVIRKQNNQKYAAKTIQNIRENDLKVVESEIMNLKKLKSDHIIQYYHHIYDRQNQQISIIMRLSKGSLRSELEKGRKWSEQQIFSFVAQITSAFLVLEKFNVVHLDLKPQNILLENQDYYKICDFGCSKIVESKIQLKGIAGTGTRNYVPPQFKLPKNCDVWSFGIILYEMVYGQHPFYSSNQQKIITKNIELYFQNKFFIDFSQDSDKVEINKLIKKMLTTRSQVRISWKQIKQTLLQSPVNLCCQPQFYEIKNAYIKHKYLCLIFINIIEMTKDNLKNNKNPFYLARKTLLNEFMDKLVNCLYIYCHIFQKKLGCKFNNKLNERFRKELTFIKNNVEIQEKKINFSTNKLISKQENISFFQKGTIQDCVKIRLTISNCRKFKSIKIIDIFCKELIECYNQKGSYFCQYQKFSLTSKQFNIEITDDLQQLNP